MRAAVFAGEGTLEIREVERPAPVREDDLLIAVEVCGICGSDLRVLAMPPLMEGRPGVTMGHEFVGEVVETGSAAEELLGARVAVLPNIHCGRCFYCKGGEHDRCIDFQHLGATRDGAFAEHVVVPAGFAHIVPDDLSSEVAALAEPLACILNGVRQAAVGIGNSVLVLGGGPIGMLFMLAAKISGAHPVIISEPAEHRRQFALELGADGVIDPTRQDVGDVTRSHTAGVGADIVFDAVGSLLDQALGSLRKGGKAILFGLDNSARTEVIPSEIASRELTIHGSYITKGTFPQALAVLAAHSDRFSRLITHHVPLEEIDAGLAEMRSGTAIKVLVHPQPAGES